MSATGISRWAELEFLAQGEDNINYLIKDEEEKYVLRLNLGSQMNLDDQIDYELLLMEYLPGRHLNY